MTIIGMHASYPLASPLLLSSSLLLIHDLGDSCKHGWGGVQGSSVMKPQVRLCERGSATPDFRLNVKPAVSEQRPRCHNVTLKEQFREGRAPARAKVSPASKKTNPKAEGRRRHLHDWDLLWATILRRGVIDCGGGIDFPSLSGEGVALRPSEDGKLAT